MSRYSKIMQRIAAGECILIDGATGTEAERRGIPQLDNAWNGGGALSQETTAITPHSTIKQVATGKSPKVGRGRGPK